MIEYTDLDGGDRLISKDRFFNILQREYLDKEIDEVGQEAYNTAVHINMLLYAMPFADAKYVKHREWIKDEFGSRCSSCGLYAYRDKFGKPWESPYCPNCGAKMDLYEVEE